MASPFRIFRKYQKTLLVVAGVVLMFVFVLGDSLSQLIRRTAQTGSDIGRWAPNAVAVRWDGGQLTNQQLRALVMRRRITNSLLRAIHDAGARQFPPGQLPELKVELVGGVHTAEQGVEQDMVLTRLFAQRAREAGMEVNDARIAHYLVEIGRRKVSIDQIRNTIKGMTFGRQNITIDFVMNALREELLARNYRANYLFTVQTVLPEQGWRDWIHVNDRLVVEAVGIAAESFLPDVPDPPEAELKAFFAQYQDQEPTPDTTTGTELPSPLPGFARPRKIKVQFVQASFDKFVDIMEDKITDEQIEEYYEQNKDPFFVRMDTGVFGEQDTTDDQQNSDEAQPVDVEEEEEEEETTLAGANVTGDAAVEVVEGDQPLESEQPSDESRYEQSAKEFRPLDEVRDEIRTRLAEETAGREMMDLMTEIKGSLESAYRQYLSKLIDAEGSEGMAAPQPPPELADLRSLAEKHGLEYGETEDLSFFELKNTSELGKLYDTNRSNVQYLLQLSHTLFSGDVELYEPIDTFDLDNNRYIVMKIKDTPGAIPEFDEVRDEVVRAWKMREAAKLALEEADKIAAQVEQSGSSLNEYFADDPNIRVVQTDPFSWYTIGNVSRATGQVASYRLSEPEGIYAAGPDFMREVYALDEQQVGAVLNHDHSIAYIVRVVGHVDSPEQLRRFYLDEADSWEGRVATMQKHMMEATFELRDHLIETTNLEWLREPDQSRQGS